MKAYSIYNILTNSTEAYLNSTNIEEAQTEAKEYLEGNIYEDLTVLRIKEESNEPIDYLHEIN